MKGIAESYKKLRGSMFKPDAIVGKDAYEIAVAEGFEGTREEWLLSLKGAMIVSTELIGQDENGGNIYRQTFDNGVTNEFVAPKGDKGDTGEKGDKGDTGEKGADGAPGKDGANGKDGADGAPGANGKDGADGEDGITPHIGANGNWFIGDTDTGVAAGGNGGGSAELPIFDLVALGLSPIEVGKGQTLNVDTTEIMTALDKGLATFVLDIVRDSGTVRYYVTPIMKMSGGSYYCYYMEKGTGVIETIFVAVSTGIIIVGVSQDALGGGGVSSWNDLTDKPFGENEDGTVKQLDNKYLEPFESKDAEDLLPTGVGETFISNLGVYAVSSQTTEKMFDRWHGNVDNAITGNVFVEFDGVTYECAQQRLAAMENAMAVGNCANFGGTGNNEPFIVSIMPDTDEHGVATGAYYWAIVALTDTAPTEHQYRVYQPYDEPKYLLKEDHLPFDAIAAYIDNYIDEALGGDY
jgi:hypothetical protein